SRVNNGSVLTASPDQGIRRSQSLMRRVHPGEEVPSAGLIYLTVGLSAAASVGCKSTAASPGMRQLSSVSRAAVPQAPYWMSSLDQRISHSLPSGGASNGSGT